MGFWQGFARQKFKVPAIPGAGAWLQMTGALLEELMSSELFTKWECDRRRTECRYHHADTLMLFKTPRT